MPFGRPRVRSARRCSVESDGTTECVAVQSRAARSNQVDTSPNGVPLPAGSAPIQTTYGVGSLREEEMRYRLHEDIFCDPRDANYPYDQLVASYYRWLE